jgi:hypothetical protein
MLLMRLFAILSLLALLAWRPFASEEEGPSIVLGSGAELCRELPSKPGASADAPLTGLVRITCNLDGALLSLENYYRVNTTANVGDPSDDLSGRLRSSRHKRGR